MSSNNFFSRIHDAIFKPTETNNGITSFKSNKFYLTIICYLISLTAFIKDPFFSNEFGAFTYKQTGLVLFIGFIIMAALHWDILLFGRPTGANLWAQILSIAPFMLFCARIFGEKTLIVSQQSVLGSVASAIKNGLENIFGHDTIATWIIKIPEMIGNLLSNTLIILFLIVILLVLCVRNTKIKISAIIILLAIPFLGTIKNNDNSMYFYIGTLSMLFGLAMQYSNYAYNIYYLNVIKSMKPAKNIDETYLRIIMRIMDKINSESKILENEVIAIVQNEYRQVPDLTNADIRNFSTDILKNMMNQYNLISLKLTQNGIIGIANPKLYHRDNLLTYIAVLPRVGLIMIITLLFIISPVDLIPDIIPLFGALDDVSLTVFSFLITKNTMEAYREK